MGGIFSYILLGLSLSAPIGPINAAQLDKGMKYGFLNAWMVGLGAMVADILYMALIYFGFSRVVNVPEVRVILWIAGSLVLLYIGLDTLWNIRNLNLGSRLAGESPVKSSVSGFMMAVSNPMNMVFWFGIYGSILAQSASDIGTGEVFVRSIGIFIGIFIWDMAMALVASLFRQYASRLVLQTISAVAGLSLVGFSGYFALQAYQAVF